MPHPPTTANTSTPVAGSEPYEKWYERRMAVFYYLLGTQATAGVLHIAAKIHYNGVELLGLLGRSAPGWDAAKSIESVTAHLVFLLSLAVGAAFFWLPWMKPRDLPAGTGTARFRAAQTRIRHGVVGGDPATDHAARIAAEHLARQSRLDPRTMLALNAIALIPVLLLFGSGMVWAVSAGDTVNVLLQAGALTPFVCVYAAQWRLVFLRRRALEFRRLHEDLLRRLHGTAR